MTEKTITADLLPFEHKRHILPLDGIRGIAVLGIMIQHFGGILHAPGETLPDRAFHLLAWRGWIGVDLFFVLSGFLITGILYDSRGEPHYFRNFYARRALRIFPVYYGFLAFLFFVLPALSPLLHDIVQNPSYQHLRDRQAWYWAYLANYLSAAEGGLSFHTGPLWSLSVEEHFYLLWPLLVYGCDRRRLLQICTGLIVLMPLLRTVMLVRDHSGQALHAAYVLTQFRLGSLATGSALALLAREPGGVSALGQMLQRWWVPVTLALLLLALTSKGFSKDTLVIATIGYAVLAIGFAALLTAVLVHTAAHPLVRFLSQPWLVFFGRHSYALYVLHYPVMGLTRHYLFDPTVTQPWLGTHVFAYVVFALLAGAVSVGAAWVIWHLVEKRCLALKRYFV